jgi:N-acyl-D-amino-acid deacylase
VIDVERLAVGPPSISHDLPAGGRRLLQGATGYLHTVVSGRVVYSGGQPTGELPGRLIRGQRPDPVAA